MTKSASNNCRGRLRRSHERNVSVPRMMITDSKGRHRMSRSAFRLRNERWDDALIWSYATGWPRRKCSGARTCEEMASARVEKSAEGKQEWSQNERSYDTRWKIKELLSSFYNKLNNVNITKQKSNYLRGSAQDELSSFKYHRHRWAGLDSTYHRFL